ncbi:MAG: hypothetical protein K8I82_08530 [Anaerolineae bacterium]|nr:hypothetical protein [Anaerolineae bacterium]
MDISWYIPERILLLRSSLSSYQPAEIDEKVSQTLKASPTALHLLLDGQLIEQMPGFFILKRWQWPRQPRLGYVAAYGMKDKSLQMIISLTSKLFGMKLSFHKTLEEAVAALRKQDASLPEPVLTVIPVEDPASRPTREVEHTRMMKVFHAQLLKAADRRCEFCRTPLPHAINLMVGELDPQEQFKFDNLCLECMYCHKFRVNRTGKIFDPLTLRDAALFNPRQDRWLEHFTWSVDGLHLVGLTPTGRATIIHLRLHSQYHQNLRKIGLKEGWHPPRKFTTNRLKNHYFPRDGRLRIEIENPITG